jgi:phosphate transport system substrate-binding protein
MNLKALGFLPLFLVFPLILLISCEKPSSSSPKAGQNFQHSIQIKGSDTMVNLGQAWAEEYMRQHPSVLIAVTGGGSGTGIAALLTNTCDIAASSRTMKEKELTQAQAKGIKPRELKVALDGLAVVVSPKNPVNQLTVDELADIFSGKIRNWKEVGGDDLPIVLLSREVNSGTHVYFKEHVLQRGEEKRKAEFDEGSLLMPSSQAIADEISQNPNAIGYYGMGYSSPTQKILAIAKDAKSPYILPTIETIMNNTYYISRPLLMYINGEPQGRIKDFMDFVLSDKGQDVVRQIDFVPIK